MDNINTVPGIFTLDESGLLLTSTNARALAQRMFAYYICSEFSQSYEFNGEVESLPYVMYRMGSDDDMSRKIKLLTESMTRYYSDAFDNVEVEIVEHDSTLNNTQTGLNVYMNLTIGDVTVSLDEIVTSDGLVRKVLDNE